ncbi:period circadian protein homolog 1b [Cyprinodon tularosa]|uniref:period circadian protein homolog 1b n=1 Tax=Cyprinodon tularosa TaxID=77115 RepID=UPI0018E2391F|nr:period circadian protein homolog 1b [Cyprinodon tularosa]XP_038150793.1 period circadian protein homolog 1b [Cyprinodon tularosa]
MYIAVLLKIKLLQLNSTTSSYTSMSYDSSTSMPSSSCRGRASGTCDKDREDEVNEQKTTCPNVSDQEQGGASSLSGDQRESHSDDMDGVSSGNDSGERESEGRAGRDGLCGHQSTPSSHSHSSSNGKDSGMMLETTDSTKSSNFQSLSPPNGSLAYSLLSHSSEHNPPSTSGWSSDQSARLQTQKELMKAIKELKLRLPAERKAKGHSSTLNALKYALQCVRQVRANKEYYHQWSVEECHGCSLDLSTFTIEELDNISSEYTLKNTDTFSMAVSFLSGKVVYVSPQCSSLLRCKPECLQGIMFSELLAPQDVSTFYSSTAPCRLPPWASCIGSASPPVDCNQEKSMFCRISGDRAQGGEMRYHPFRLTPYQLTLRDSDAAEPQPCCLLIAEKVHSGYEAPRIPADKRIFTTSHTPNCLFQEVDERAVPLLGYLPQDLVGTPILLYIHPDDRPTMVAIHEKIFQFAGQPFDYSPLRMCARSGEYVTIDTSWSSFVNPWSRKVAFVVGRHKVRTSPLNEDVFTTAMGGESRVTTPDVFQLSEQIHRVLVQPVHSGGSQGYSSLGSSGSRGSQQQHPSASAASSSESNGPAMDEVAVASHKPMTFQQICKDVHTVKTNGQQVFIESRNRPPPRKNTCAGAAGFRTINSDAIRESIADLTQSPRSLVPAALLQKEPSTGYSYQQINCLDSIIRYLESCNIPNTVKRKCGSSSCTASSTSDEDKKANSGGHDNGGSVNLVGEPPPLPPLTMASKAESVASVTSQCSFSSTIVHVGDKKPPESDIVMEEAPPTPTPVTTATHPKPPTATSLTPAAPISTTTFPSPLPPPPPPPTHPPASQPERDSWRSGSVGGVAAGGGAPGRLGLTKEVLSAHTQQEEQAFLDRFNDLSRLRVLDQTASLTTRGQTPPALSRGVRCSRDYPAAGSGTGRRRGRGGKRLKHQESSDQHGSQPLNRQDSRAPAASAPLNVPIGHSTNSPSWPSAGSQASLPAASFPPGMLPIYPVYPQLPQPLPGYDPTRFPPTQMVPPMMAFVLPNYMFPQMGMPMSQPGGSGQFYNPTYSFPGMSPFPFPSISNPLPGAGACAPSRSSTPQSFTQTPADREGAESPLFQSRCSSPLNLLQLEETPSNRLEVATALAASQQAQPSVQGAAAGVQSSANKRSSEDPSKENENVEAVESNQDAMSTSSDLLDLLLQEDSRSGTGSAASGSGSSGTRSSGSGSGSNGCSSSGTSGTISSQGSHTSKYFGSIDSSENDHSRKQPAGGGSSAGGDGGEDQFIKCVLQDPIWLLMANTDDKVMMTYQLPVRNMETVLQEDREALRNMQKHQPRFTEEQKKELGQVHPWIRTGRLPRSINIPGCTGCKCPPSVPPTTPFDVEIHEMELCTALKTQEECSSKETAARPETAMDDVQLEDEDEEEEAQRKDPQTQENTEDMVQKEERVEAETVKDRTET